MKAANKAAVGLILVGIAATAFFGIGHYRARADALAATGGFNGERAFKDLRQLVQFGPRPAGSQNLERSRAYIKRQLSTSVAEIWDDPFVATTPMGKVPVTNVIGVIHGENPTVVILAGHYDTATIAGARFVGANDGGSSAAFLLEMARVLHRRTNKFTYWLVFFDGEEALKQWTASDSLYGSRHLAEKLSRKGKLGQIKALILLDMVADRHLSILRESNSTGWLSDAVFRSASTLGYGSLFSGGTFPVEDDHKPFLAKGIPSVDIIDLTPFRSYHHTAQDSIDKCDPESLTVVGRVVLTTLAELERTG
jgi:Zn-dependent M28 family amino/carboxypeptidase